MHMDKGRVCDYPGNYDYYLEKHEQTTVNTNIAQNKTYSDSKEDYLRQKKQEAELRKKRNRLRQVEKEIEIAEEEVEQIKTELCSPENVTDYIKCAELSAKQNELDEKLLELYEEWEKLQESL